MGAHGVRAARRPPISFVGQQAPGTGQRNIRPIRFRLPVRLGRNRPESRPQVRHECLRRLLSDLRATEASHLNYVACHTQSWEQAAVFQLERLAREGQVECYARNYRLEFTIPYELHDESRAYEPDFIVRMRNGGHVVLEIKGFPDPDADAKHQAARRWVEAVNNWGECGVWNFVVCRDPQGLENDLMQALTSGRQ